MFFNFEKVTLPKSTNYCIVAPKKMINKRWFEPKVFNLSKAELEKRWKHMLAKKPRVTMLAQENNQIKYVQQSRVFKFKDIVVVQFNTLDADHSNLYVYSHSLSGYWDFGVNCKRVSHWMAGL